MIKKGNETFAGYNKAKATPGHSTKSHAVLAKIGSKVKLIRFGQKGVSGSPEKRANQNLIGSVDSLLKHATPAIFLKVK